jgi:hypothetical protein
MTHSEFYLPGLPRFLIQAAPVSSRAERMALPWVWEILVAGGFVGAWVRLRSLKTNSKSVVFFEATLTVATCGSKPPLLTFKM